MPAKILKREDLIYPELSYEIIGILYEIYNDLGCGYQEKYYQKALSLKFKERNIVFQEQLMVSLKFQGNNIGKYFLDFLIENKIILEIKKDEQFSRNNIEQVYAYLKATNLKLGIIANFTKQGLKFKRIVNLNS